MNGQAASLITLLTLTTLMIMLSSATTLFWKVLPNSPLALGSIQQIMETIQLVALFPNLTRLPLTIMLWVTVASLTLIPLRFELQQTMEQLRQSGDP